eukprot:COSAG06_NODE_20254_length_802_cov_1.773826_1_plen_108_part_10
MRLQPSSRRKLASKHHRGRSCEARMTATRSTHSDFAMNLHSYMWFSPRSPATRFRFRFRSSTVPPLSSRPRIPVSKHRESSTQKESWVVLQAVAKERRSLVRKRHFFR